MKTQFPGILLAHDLFLPRPATCFHNILDQWFYKIFVLIIYIIIKTIEYKSYPVSKLYLKQIPLMNMFGFFICFTFRSIEACSILSWLCKNREKRIQIFIQIQLVSFIITVTYAR